MSAVSDAAVQFAVSIADAGCRVTHGGRAKGTTCRDIRAEAQDGGRGWGTEGESGAWRDHIAAGRHLCNGCRAWTVIHLGEYVPPSRDLTVAERAAAREAER